MLLMVLVLYRLDCGLCMIFMCLICVNGRFWYMVRLRLVLLMCMLLISIIVWFELVLCRNSEFCLLSLLVLVRLMLVWLCSSFCSEVVWLDLICVWLIIWVGVMLFCRVIGVWVVVIRIWLSVVVFLVVWVSVGRVVSMVRDKIWDCSFMGDFRCYVCLCGEGEEL